MLKKEYFCRMFLQSIKKVFLLIAILLVAVSCGEYHKVLKSEEIAPKFAKGEELYNEGIENGSKAKLRKALRLFEQIVPGYRGKPQAEKLMFMYSNTYYELGDYYLAGYQFERYVELYPNSSKVEEAAFKAAKSYYYESPRYSLDQSQTIKAIDELQEYINRFPEGESLEEANNLVAELRVKLDKKAYEIAKQYHHRMNYKAAIAAFENFILDYPGSPYRESAYYYRFESAYLLAINSVVSKEQERLAAAEDFYNSYTRYYPEGEFTEEAEDAVEEIRKRRTENTL